MTSMLLAFLMTAAANAGEIKFPKIDARPAAADYSFQQGNISTASFKFDPDSRDAFRMDLRNCDLGGYDLSAEGDLPYASFNSLTRFPARLPPGYSPAKAMELGKNPGLGLRRLHRQGVTGRGVGVGVIDQALLTGHAEYAARLRLYEEYNWRGREASMHGPAVASLAVGANTGAAPGADLYFIAQENGASGPGGEYVYDLGHVARSIDRLLEVNRSLPADRKIRVISISLAMVEKWKGYPLAAAAMRRAAREGVFVLTVGDRKFPQDGLGRQPLADPDSKDSYTGGLMFCSNKWGSPPGELQVPMDSRTLADPNGPRAYFFSRVGGQSWIVPWTAGLYALACQVYPAVTPELFWRTALDTADEVVFKKDGLDRRLRHVVNPERLIAALRRLAGTEKPGRKK